MFYANNASEPVLHFDREPVRTRLDFTGYKEDQPMSKEQFVVHCIRCHEDFPAVGEIDLATARSVIENLAPDNRLPSMTAEEFMTYWNVFVHDPKVTAIN